MKKLWLLAGLVLGVGMLALTARYVDVGHAWEVLRGIDLRYAALTLVVSLFFLVVKAWRWSMLLSPIAAGKSGMRLSELAPAVCAGTAANLIVPHAGELARVFMVNDRRAIAVSALLASIALERLFDFAAVLALLGVAFALHPDLPGPLVSAGIVAAVLFAVLLAASLLLVYQSAAMLHLLAGVLKIFPTRVSAFVLQHVQSGVAGLESLRNAQVLIKVSLASLLQWLTIVVVIFCSVRAVGPAIPAAAAIAVLALMVAGLTLPAAPIYVGTTQLAFALGLTAFSIAPAISIAASVVYTAFCLLPMLLVGGVYLYRRGWHGVNVPRPV